MKFLPSKTSDAPKEEKEMSFLEHIEELRWHLVRSALAVVVIGVVAFLNEKIITGIIFGPRTADFFTYKLFCQYFDTFCTVPYFEIIQKDIGERFFTHLKVSVWIGIMLGFPYLFWEFWKFIKPGLYAHERKAARGIVFVCSMLFFLGVLFGYYVIAPFAISFLAGYEFGEDITPTATLSSYVSYLTMITLPTGIVFELPIVAYFLAKIGLISSDLMKKFRRHSVVIIFIASAIITPPDVITQFLIAIPLMLLYEISISVVKRIEKKNKEED
jgi:sec-independent protein translocase protein TatC